MNPLYLYLHIVLFISQNEIGNLVEICFWVNLAVRGLINIKETMQLIIESQVLMASCPIFRLFIFPYSLSREILVVTFLWVVDFKLFFFFF